MTENDRQALLEAADKILYACRLLTRHGFENYAEQAEDLALEIEDHADDLP